MGTIMHIARRKDWEGAKEKGCYRGDTLENQGFIHCSTPGQVIKVANSLYRGRRDLVLLRIDPDRVEPEIRYEGEGETYPHIYGPLNLDAVTSVLEFQPDDEGFFRTPPSGLSQPMGMGLWPLRTTDKREPHRLHWGPSVTVRHRERAAHIQWVEETTH